VLLISSSKPILSTSFSPQRKEQSVCRQRYSQGKASLDIGRRPWLESLDAGLTRRSKSLRRAAEGKSLSFDTVALKGKAAWTPAEDDELKLTGSPVPGISLFYLEVSGRLETPARRRGWRPRIRPSAVRALAAPFIRSAWRLGLAGVATLA